MKDFKIESEFEHKGYKCVVVAQRLGHRCGYIGISKSNLAYGRDDSDLYDISVHGGLTYSGGGEDSEYPIKSDMWWLGFDCAHSGDAKDLDMVREFNKDNSNLDFLLSLSNYGTVRTLEYCIKECQSVVDQIIDMNNKGDN